MFLIWPDLVTWPFDVGFQNIHTRCIIEFLIYERKASGDGWESQVESTHNSWNRPQIIIFLHLHQLSQHLLHRWLSCGYRCSYVLKQGLSLHLPCIFSTTILPSVLVATPKTFAVSLIDHPSCISLMKSPFLKSVKNGGMILPKREPNRRSFYTRQCLIRSARQRAPVTLESGPQCLHGLTRTANSVCYW